MGGVRPHRGITVIPTCGAAPAPVMPQVRRTWGRAESREKTQLSSCGTIFCTCRLVQTRADSCRLFFGCLRGARLVGAECLWYLSDARMLRRRCFISYRPAGCAAHRRAALVAMVRGRCAGATRERVCTWGVMSAPGDRREVVMPQVGPTWGCKIFCESPVRPHPPPCAG